MSKLPLEVIIDSTYYVPGVGTVVGGIVTQGSIQPNDSVWLGPNANGQFRQATVKTIHVKQASTLSLHYPWASLLPLWFLAVQGPSSSGYAFLGYLVLLHSNLIC